MHARRASARLWVAALAFGMLMTNAGVAAAQPDIGRARDAYDRGVRAHAAGDHATAAKAFAEADALAPTAASLEAALEAAMRADDAALGVELLQRSDARSYPDGSLLKSIEAARKRFAKRTGTIRVDCKGVARCLISVDGRAADATKPVIATIGPHSVVIERGEDRFERLVEVTPNAVSLVTGPETPTPVTPKPIPPFQEPSRSSRTLSPVWFWIGAAATLGFGAAATISGLKASSNHDEFEKNGCAPGATGPKASNCDELANDGQGLTTRTNIFIVVGGLFAINTAVLGGWYVKWSSAPAGGTGGTASLGGRFQ